jgi:hypothetical protein
MPTTTAPASTIPPAPKVYMSYSRESKSHVTHVRVLTDRLRKDGVNAVLDLHAPLSGPAEGWSRWTEKRIQESDFILMVCSEKYKRHFTDPEKLTPLLAAQYEIKLIRKEIHNPKVEAKLLPVILDSGDHDSIPQELAAKVFFDLSSDSGYEELLRAIFASQRSDLPSPEQAEPPPPNVEQSPAPEESGAASAVPELPLYYYPREECLQRLKGVLLESAGGDDITDTVIIHGIAGVGKTVLASALARDAEIEESFSEGVLWIPLDSVWQDRFR